MTVKRILPTLLLSAGLLAASAPLLPAQAGPLSWIGGGERVQGSGKVVKQNRDVGHFRALSVGIGGDVEIRSGNTEGVTVETDDNVQALIETVVENGVLRVRTAKNVRLDTRHLKVIVQARTLDKLSIGGSGNVTADKLRGESLTIDIGGSGSFNVDQVESESLAVALGGSGSFKAAGNTERLQVSIGGSGRVQASQLQSRDAVVSIGGSGQATVWARKTLNVSVAGSGDINYYGDPQISKSIMGSGTIKRMGSAPR